MKPGNAFRLAVVLVIVGAVVAAGWLASGHLLRPEVSVAPVERGRAVNAVPGVLRVVAERIVELRGESGGRVAESALVLGANVSEGEVLVRLEDSDLRLAVERTRIDLEAEEASREVGRVLRYDLEEAREELERIEDLVSTGRYSRSDLDAQRRRIARITDEIRLEEIREVRRIGTLENELRRLEEELEKRTIRSPVDGVVTDVHAFPGDLLAPRGSVARILSAERIVEATLSEENFAGVEPGQVATVRFLTYGSRLFPATVAKMLPAADPETQRYTVHLDVDMPSELMIPGITGEVSIVVGERDGALIVPRRALVGRQVFVIGDGRVESREVRRGFISLNRAEILEGLEEGEIVAVENLDRLRHGDRVRVRGKR